MTDDGPRPDIAGLPQAVTLAVEVVRHGGAFDGSAVSDATVELAAHAAFSAAPPEAQAPYEATIVLTDDAEMLELNREWRGKDAPTNVLSFPAGEAPGEVRALGDIVIAYETAQKEAEADGIALSDHVSHLTVHGMLHLLGFDHEDDDEAERMEDLERQALASLGIADPYARADEGDVAETTS